MINKISDNITPLPTGVRVEVVQNAATENIYIIEVQPSPYKPHQYDNTYFVRLDGQTKPAPHYFIEALFKRISYPNIEGYIKVEKAGLIQNPSRYYLTLSVFLFNFSQLQNEEDVTVRLMTVPGEFQHKIGTDDPYNSVRKIGSLHFGLVQSHTEIIIINANELQGSNYKVHIMMSYAGKSSPAKSSDYTLDLRKIDLDVATNTLQLFEDIEENKLFAESQQQLGTTRESSLFSALGRQPNQ